MTRDAAYALGEFLGDAFNDYQARRVAQENQAAYDDLLNRANRRINETVREANRRIKLRDDEIRKGNEYITRLRHQIEQLEAQVKELRESDRIHRGGSDHWANQFKETYKLLKSAAGRALEERAQRVSFAHELAKLAPDHPLLRCSAIRLAVVEAAREHKKSGFPVIDSATDGPVIARLEQELARHQWPAQRPPAGS